VTGEPHRPTRCWVVASGKIGAEAHSAFEAELSQHRGSLRFLDGDTLWEKVQEHLLTSSVTQSLAQVHDILENVSDNYRVLALPTKGGAWFTLQAKHPNAQVVEPLEIKGALAFPDTEEGKQEFKKFQHHVETGAPVTIEAQYLQGFSLPDFLQRLIDPEGLGPGAIVLGPTVPLHPVALRLVMESESAIQ
jgi:hypothetical protein